MAKILLVDDDKTTLLVMKSTLEQGGHDVFTTTDGIYVEEMIQSNTPDLVITDIVMEEQEGVETVLQIKEKHPDLPILVMSSHDDYLNMIKGFEINNTISKPIDKDTLLLTVNSLV